VVSSGMPPESPAVRTSGGMILHLVEAQFNRCLFSPPTVTSSSIRRSSWAYSCTFGQGSHLLRKANSLPDYENLIEIVHFAWKNAGMDAARSWRYLRLPTCP